MAHNGDQIEDGDHRPMIFRDLNDRFADGGEFAAVKAEVHQVLNLPHIDTEEPTPYDPEVANVLNELERLQPAKTADMCITAEHFVRPQGWSNRTAALCLQVFAKMKELTGKTWVYYPYIFFPTYLLPCHRALALLNGQQKISTSMC